jgi:protein disulfide-isomerase A1
MQRMCKLVAFLLFFLNSAFCYDDILESDYIKELHLKTFQNFLKENDYVLLEFYTEGCPHCQEFAPIFLEAAKEMKFTPELSQVKIAKIDGQKYEEVTNSYDVKGFPDVKLISLKNGIQADYFGERTVQSLVKFVKSRITKKVTEIESIKQLTLLEASKKHMLVICGRNETYPDVFKQGNKLMMQHDDLELFYTNNTEVMKNLDCTYDKLGLVLIKNYDERRLKYDAQTYNASHFEEWFNIYSLPTLVRLSDENIQISLQQQLPSVILITKNDDSDETYELRQLLKSRAKKLRVKFK